MAEFDCDRAGVISIELPVIADMLSPTKAKIKGITNTKIEDVTHTKRK